MIPDASDYNIFHLLSTRATPFNSVEISKGFYAKLRVSYDSQGQLNANSGLVFDDYYDCYSNVQELSSMVGTEFNAINGSSNNDHDEAPFFAVAPVNVDGPQKVFVRNEDRVFSFSIVNGIFSYDGVFYNLSSLVFGAPDSVFPTIANLSVS